MTNLEPSPVSINDIRALSFQSIGTLGKIMDSGLPELSILKRCGIYAITTPESYEPEFIPPDAAKECGNVIKPYPLPKLADKWVEGEDVVYIGLAGKHSRRTIRQRLRQLIRHGQGHTTDRGPHKGGEILWQLEGFESFTLWVMPTGDPPEPRETEKRLLLSFERQTGKLPFANRQH